LTCGETPRFSVKAVSVRHFRYRKKDSETQSKRVYEKNTGHSNEVLQSVGLVDAERDL